MTKDEIETMEQRWSEIFSSDDYKDGKYNDREIFEAGFGDALDYIQTECVCGNCRHWLPSTPSTDDYCDLHEIPRGGYDFCSDFEKEA